MTPGMLHNEKVAKGGPLVCWSSRRAPFHRPLSKGKASGVSVWGRWSLGPS
jgi:hypothetical protein